MTDIVKDLWTSMKTAGESGSVDESIEILREALREAIAEIERLRELAGAVSSGPSFVDLRKTAVHVSDIENNLRNIDG